MITGAVASAVLLFSVTQEIIDSAEYYTGIDLDLDGEIFEPRQETGVCDYEVRPEHGIISFN